MARSAGSHWAIKQERKQSCREEGVEIEDSVRQRKRTSGGKTMPHRIGRYIVIAGYRGLSNTLLTSLRISGEMDHIVRSPPSSAAELNELTNTTSPV
jgi:hypothetical protein